MAAPAELGDHLGYWLRFVSNHVSQAFARKVEGQGVTVAEWVVLRVLYDTPAVAPSRLAAQLGMTRGAISKLADRLETKGLVSRTANPADARAHTLSATPAGRSLAPVLAALADANEAEFFADLPADDRAALQRILRGIVARRGLTSAPMD